MQRSRTLRCFAPLSMTGMSSPLQRQVCSSPAQDDVASNDASRAKPSNLLPAESELFEDGVGMFAEGGGRRAEGAAGAVGADRIAHRLVASDLWMGDRSSECLSR